MTRTPEATARPWSQSQCVNPEDGSLADQWTIASTTEFGPGERQRRSVAWCTTEANARLIVRAVNAHDALVEAVKEALAFLDDEQVIGSLPDQLIAALALAGEGEGR